MKIHVADGTFDAPVWEPATGHGPGLVLVQEDAGHAFHNHVAPMFHHPVAAATAWDLTTGFLARTLPT